MTFVDLPSTFYDFLSVLVKKVDGRDTVCWFAIHFEKNLWEKWMTEVFLAG